MDANTPQKYHFTILTYKRSREISSLGKKFLQHLLTALEIHKFTKLN